MRKTILLLFGMIIFNEPSEAAEDVFGGKPIVFSAPVVGGIFKNRVPSAPYFAKPFDFDGDRRSEILLTYFNWPPDNPKRAEPIKILKINPNNYAYTDNTSTFLSGSTPSFVHPRVLAYGDFDGDNRPDLFLGGHGYDQMPAAGEKDWLLLSSPGPKHRSLVAEPRVATFTHAAASGDINRDGVDDIYVGVICCSGQGPYFLMGRKKSTPIVDQTRLSTAIAQREKTYTAAAITDVNGDGWPDLILGVAGDNRSVIYLNDKAGSFAHEPPDRVLPDGLFGATNTIVLDMFATDLNFDGRPDLVLLETANNYIGYALQILINRGNGNFVDETSSRMPNSGIDTGSAARLHVVPTSFFGDRIVDFVTPGFGPGVVNTPIIWLNDGSGNFSARSRVFFDSVDTTQDNGAILPVDINQDGRSDIARILFGGEQGSYYVKTYKNQGFTNNSKAIKPNILRAPPAQATATIGSTVLLSALARGSRPLSFQWSKNGSPIAGATSPLLRVSAANSSAAGTYTVKITNSAGSLTKSTKLTVK